jgi:hypothetical protein
MRDSWCSAIFINGQKLSGGAARNVRIAAAGGMDEIIERAARKASREAVEEASRAARRIHGDNIIQLRGTLRSRAG